MSGESGLSHYRAAVWRYLLTCWTDPDAPAETRLEFYKRQVEDLLRQIPMATVATYVVIALALVAGWPHGRHGNLVAWAVCVGGICTANFFLWWRVVVRKSSTPTAWVSIWYLTIALLVAALLYSAMVVYFFGVLAAADREVLFAVTAAFIATGAWMFASVPMVGVVWAVALCWGIAVGLFTHYGAQFVLPAVLLMFFSCVLVGTVMVSSRKFIAFLKAEAETGKQRQLVALLLRDFEENASDWLWETDAEGNLRYVSAKLTEAVGQPADKLNGKSLTDILKYTLVETASDQLAKLRRLDSLLRRRKAFSDVVVSVNVDGQKRWWSFTAKPLRDGEAQFAGWRGVVSDITEVQERNLELERVANFDSLTGLANRHHFQRKLASHFPDGAPVRPCILMMLDLDNFKTVNDALGHAAGDALLTDVALRLHSVTPQGSVLARLGGDEFAVIIPNAMSRDVVQTIGQRMSEVLAQKWVHGDSEIMMHASIGVAEAPNHAEKATDLLKACDLALFAAKAAGRDTLRFFEIDMQLSALRRQTVLSDIQKSLPAGDFLVYYQPLIDLKTGALCGFEALVRWRHPARGIVAPVEFIPIAEDSGLIVPLGSWVLAQACKDAATWPEGLQVSVNVSAAQVERPEFLATVQDALRNSGLAAQRLELEITESTLMQDSEVAQKLLRSLRGIGVRIALDDFGTGFSSLAYLLSFPLDKLKIDQSFVRQMETDQKAGKATAVVSTITQLAHVLGLETTAEGIETPEQLAVLRDMGCSFGQGYLYARPMDARSAAVFMEHWAKVSVVAQVPHEPPREWNKTVDSAYARIATRQVPLSAQSKWASL